MKKIKVLTTSIVYMEEHGKRVVYPPGTELAVSRPIAKQWKEEGTATLLEAIRPLVRGPAAPAPPTPWEIRSRRLNLQKRIEEARASVRPPPSMSKALNLPQGRASIPEKPGALVFSGTSELVDSARQFWFNNETDLEVGGEAIDRAAMYLYGGPAPRFNRCETCQRTEWLSRLHQSNLFEPHSGCPTAEACKVLCQKQGNPAFPHQHQNHWFGLGCDRRLNAPRCVYVMNDRWYDSHFRPGGSHVTLNKRRALARACQVDVRKHSEWDKIDWDMYDLLYMNNSRTVPLLKKPDLPILMYGHDHWKGNPQATLDHYRPDILMTPFPALWKKNMQIPAGTRVELYALSASQFFTSPTIDPGEKAVDLLCIGAKSKGPTGPYGPRIAFHEQALQLPDSWSVAHSHIAQFGYAHPTVALSEKVTMLNFYSAALGRARYVAFAPCQGLALGGMWIKYYEVLGCGAIPIMPKIDDLDLLGVKPWEHYIPFSEIAGNNGRLIQLLESYEENRHIGENAAAWHMDNADRELFGRFENAVQELSGHVYDVRCTGLEEKLGGKAGAEKKAVVSHKPFGLPATFVTIPREWFEPLKTRQENAIGSWMCCEPRPNLALFCDDPGTEAAAKRWGARYVPDSARNDQGTPRVNDVFLRGQEIAREAGTEFTVYCNTDVVLGAGFMKALGLVASKFDKFLMVGARWDVNWEWPINFDDPAWEAHLLDYVKKNGARHSQGALDYFAFRTGLYETMPPFAVGRSAWDNWLVCEANFLGADTVDAGSFVTAVHQNMPSKKSPPTPEQVEKQFNWSLYAKRNCGHQSGSANNCRWVIKPNGSFTERAGKKWRP